MILIKDKYREKECFKIFYIFHFVNNSRKKQNNNNKKYPKAFQNIVAIFKINSIN